LTLLAFILGGCVLYLLMTLGLTYLVLQLPRNPVEDKPDWGKVTDATLATEDGGMLEVWRRARRAIEGNYCAGSRMGQEPRQDGQPGQSLWPAWIHDGHAQRERSRKVKPSPFHVCAEIRGGHRDGPPMGQGSGASLWAFYRSSGCRDRRLQRSRAGEAPVP